MLEEHVLDTMPNAVKTKGSGSVKGDGDIHTPRFMVECKTKNRSEGISIAKHELKKAKQQALKVNRRLLFVLRNGLDEEWACIPYSDLVALLELEAEADD